MVTPKQVKAAAEAKAAEDLALLESLQKRDVPKPKAGPTIGDNFVASAALLAETRQRTRLSEPTLLKLFELQMMWALNARQNPQYEDLIGPAEEAETPEPHEIITEASDNGE